MSIVTLIRLKIAYFFPELIFLLSSAFVTRSNAKKIIHSKRWRNQPIWVIYWLGYNWTSIKQLLWYWVMNIRRRREKKRWDTKESKKTLGLVFKCCFLYQTFRGWLFSHLCGSAMFWMLFLSHVENWVLFIPILNVITCKRRTFNWLLYPSTLDAVNPSSGNSSSLSHYLHEHINHNLKNGKEILLNFMSSMNLFHHATQIKYELNSEKQGFGR